MPAAEATSLSGLLAATLSKSWVESTPPDLPLSEPELDQVAPLLYQSGAAGLGWWRIRDSNLRQTPSGEMLHQAFRLLALQSAIHEGKIRRVFTVLRSVNIEPILIKGWAMARDYPQPALRPYGDIDLILRPRDTNAIAVAKGPRDCRLDFQRLPVELGSIDRRVV